METAVNNSTVDCRNKFYIQNSNYVGNDPIHQDYCKSLKKYLDRS